MATIPLTKEESLFATECHSLVYAFLNKKNLPHDEYYDVVVFGYLRAVKRYFTESPLQKYSFSTIAWSCMYSDLKNHYNGQSCQKRSAITLSLNAPLSDTDYCLEDVLPSPNSVMAQLEQDLILHDLATRISKRHMKATMMKKDGYKLREIAKIQKTSVKRVCELLDEVYDILQAVCHE